MCPEVAGSKLDMTGVSRLRDYSRGAVEAGSREEMMGSCLDKVGGTTYPRRRTRSIDVGG